MGFLRTSTGYLLLFCCLTHGGAAAATKANSFVDQGNGSVADVATGLTWQQSDDNVTRNWDAAVAYCNNLNLAGSNAWRLPNIKELLSLVFFEGSPNRNIRNRAFPGTSGTFEYWSSTERAGDSSRAWAVHFSSDFQLQNDLPINSTLNKSEGGLFVRCVR
ncbi:MAG: DUF1566 domain-containing protein [Pseudomonadota bacterium]